MKKYIIISGIAICVLGFSRISRNENDDAQINTAIKKSVYLLQQSSHTFIKNAHCFSCHGQALGAVTFSMAKAKGFTLNDTLAQEASQRMLSAGNSGYARSMFMEHNELLGGSISSGYVLWGLSAADCKPCKATAITVHQLMERQTADGHWVGGNGRPPLEYYSISVTALVIKGIQAYASPLLKDRVNLAKEKPGAGCLIQYHIPMRRKHSSFWGLCGQIPTGRSSTGRPLNYLHFNSPMAAGHSSIRCPPMHMQLVRVYMRCINRAY
jgi:hypothetical protein